MRKINPDSAVRDKAPTDKKKRIHHRDAEYAEFGVSLIKNSASASSVPRW
jgi:hypothetical protein